MSDTTTLPPLTDSMTAADLVTRVIALRQSIGPKAEINLSVHESNPWLPDQHKHVCMHMFPSGYSGDNTSSQTIYAATWPDAFAQAEAWARNWKITSRENTIRNMALAIIKITDRDGNCAEQVLLNRKFTREQVLEFHEAACARAGEMRAGAPFSVVLA